MKEISPCTLLPTADRLLLPCCSSGHAAISVRPVLRDVKLGRWQKRRKTWNWPDCWSVDLIKSFKSFEEKINKNQHQRFRELDSDLSDLGDAWAIFLQKSHLRSISCISWAEFGTEGRETGKPAGNRNENAQATILSCSQPIGRPSSYWVLGQKRARGLHARLSRLLMNAASSL